jgi:hypothetical protein
LYDTKENKNLCEEDFKKLRFKGIALVMNLILDKMFTIKRQILTEEINDNIYNDLYKTNYWMKNYASRNFEFITE